jgi:hypothetical protein
MLEGCWICSHEIHRYGSLRTLHFIEIRGVMVKLMANFAWALNSI